ncbi:MAG TPA: hypothetical protein VKE74_15605 [Gemmataceae bacterium]|nr:hypothetical protein [Gemmataceae bacterium]
MPLRLTPLAFAALAAFAPPARASEPPPPRYYFILFGGQSVPFIPRTSHTWAVYTKATPTVSGAVYLETVTISWLPVGRDVRVRNLRPVEGHNCTLDQTLAIMAAHHAQVSMWGPYEIDGCRYELAVQQVAFLESGEVTYRVLDSFTRNPHVCHCVHAVTYADPVVKQRIQPVIRVGEPGTSRLAAMYANGGAFVGYPQTHDWLIPALGLDRYPIIRRQPGEYVPRQWR